jgi:acyl-CoA synthetase (AMP-forming)/AMP-acid ligase II
LFSYYDAKGILYYHDRLKALVKYNNIHIYPTAIEDVFHKHPEVLEAGVFGRPDPLCQELLTAVVIKREGF